MLNLPLCLRVLVAKKTFTPKTQSNNTAAPLPRCDRRGKNKTHPNPSREGMHPHSASLFDDTFLNETSLIARSSERNAVVSIPSPEGRS